MMEFHCQCLFNIILNDNCYIIEMLMFYYFKQQCKCRQLKGLIEIAYYKSFIHSKIYLQRVCRL